MPEAEFLGSVFDRLSSHQITAEEAVPTKLLKQFEGVILEESSVIGLPKELSGIWQGCGGRPGASQAGVKLFVRWDVLAGHLHGPWLANAKDSDRESPFEGDPIPAGSLYLADLGFFGLEHLSDLMQRQGRRKGYVITRLLSRTALYLRNGHRIELQGVLPKRVGEAREMGVLVGKTARLPMRLILVRVPKQVGDQRRQQIIADASDHGRVLTDETLYLADWTLVLTNVPHLLKSIIGPLWFLRLLEKNMWQSLDAMIRRLHRPVFRPVEPGTSAKMRPDCIRVKSREFLAGGARIDATLHARKAPNLVQRYIARKAAISPGHNRSLPGHSRQ